MNEIIINVFGIDLKVRVRHIVDEIVDVISIYFVDVPLNMVVDYVDHHNVYCALLSGLETADTGLLVDTATEFVEKHADEDDIDLFREYAAPKGYVVKIPYQK